jgi:GWxTD domain-containing protein
MRGFATFPLLLVRSFLVVLLVATRLLVNLPSSAGLWTVLPTHASTEAAPGQDQETPKEFYDSALQAIKKKDFMRAGTNLLQVIKSNSLYQDRFGRSAWYWLGYAFELQGKKQEAIKVLEQGYNTLRISELKDWYLNYDLARLYAETNKENYDAEITKLVYDVFKYTTPKQQPDLWTRIIEETEVLFKKEERFLLNQSLTDPEGRPGQQLLRFFRREDPSPLTEQNELLAVFFQRTAEARKRFASSVSPRGYDERGEIYVRLGPPYSILSDHSGTIGAGVTDYLLYPYEVWFYRNIDSDIYYTFTRPRGKPHYVIVDGPESIFNTSYKIMVDNPEYIFGIGTFYRGSRFTSDQEKNIEQIVLELREDLYMKLAGQHDTFRRRVYELSNLLTAEDALQYSKTNFVQEDKEHVAKRDTIAPTVVYRIGDYTEELPISISIARFRAKSGKARTEIYYSVPYKYLDFAPAANGYQAQLLGQIGIFNENYELVAGNYIQGSCLATTSEATTQGEFINQWNYLLTPDHYNLVLSLEDTAGKRLGVIRSKLEIVSFPPTSLCLSDIQLSSHIQETGAKNQFVKNGFLVVPKPNPSIDKDKSLYVYFEIYNLSFDELGQTRYQIDYRLDSKQKKKGFFSKILGGKGGKKPSIMLSETRIGSSRDQIEYVAMELAKLKTGKATLQVIVTDLNNSQQVSSQVAFNLIDD